MWTDAPPVDVAAWRRFLDLVGQEQRGDADVGGVTFRELFDQSPAPTMSQDYSLVVGWMDELRTDGVDDLRVYLDGRPDLLALAVSQIRITAANPAGIAIIGKPAQEVIGYIDPAIVNRGSHVSWTRQLETVWNGERSAVVEFVGPGSMEASSMPG